MLNWLGKQANLVECSKSLGIPHGGMLILGSRIIGILPIHWVRLLLSLVICSCRSIQASCSLQWRIQVEVLRISDGGKVRPYKELFLIQSDSSVRGVEEVSQTDEREKSWLWRQLSCHS